MDATNIAPIYGTAGLLITCAILICSLVISLGALWLLVACIVDVSRKDEKAFPEKNMWLIFLIGGAFFGVGFLISLVYFFMYKPKLRFWNR